MRVSNTKRYQIKGIKYKEYHTKKRVSNQRVSNTKGIKKQKMRVSNTKGYQIKSKSIKYKGYQNHKKPQNEGIKYKKSQVRYRCKWSNSLMHTISLNIKYYLNIPRWSFFIYISHKISNNKICWNVFKNAFPGGSNPAKIYFPDN